MKNSLTILLVLATLTFSADRVAPEKAVLPEPPCCTAIISGAITGDSIMKQIELTQGKFAIVDDEDFEVLSKNNWYAQKNGTTFYAVRQTRCMSGKSRQRLMQMHKVILGFRAKKEIDHRDGNGLNNTKTNLRFCTHRENSTNRRKSALNNRGKKCSSKYRGVYFHKQRMRWVAQIRNKHIGLFDDEIQAAKAYDAKAKELFGEFVRLNF